MDLKSELISFIKDLLESDTSYARLSETKIESLVEECLKIPNNNEFTPPFRHGRSNSYAILDSNGKLVKGFSTHRNGRSKSKLFLKLLEYRFKS
jgi:hypothetical protein